MEMHLVQQTKLQLRHNISKHDNFLKYNENSPYKYQNLRTQISFYSHKLI